MDLWKTVCAGMLAVVLAAGTAGMAFAAEGQSDMVVVSQGPDKAFSQQAATAFSKAETKADTEKAALNQRIDINLAACSLALFRDGKKIRLYPIGVGKPSTPTPTGYYKIMTKEINPTWIDPSDPEFSIPSGEENPLGYRWMQIYGNYGIHGTNKPDSVGQYVSNGCIRMREKDVEALYDLVEPGTPVDITYNRVVVEKIDDNQIVYYIYPDGYGWQNLTVKDVERWLAGYGVDDFVSTEDIEKKIANSDGEPTYVAKVYPLYVNGTKTKGKAVIQDGITYLPAVDLAEAVQISLGWKPAEKVLVSSYGEAVGYEKKDVLYCNADDVSTLFHVDGGVDKDGRFDLKKTASALAPVVDGGMTVAPKASTQEAVKAGKDQTTSSADQTKGTAKQKK